MSLFGQSSSGAGSSAGNLFSGLSVNTTPGVDAAGKRKSIFDPSTSHSPAPSQPSLFGGTSATSTTAGPSFFSNPTATTTSSTPFNFKPTTTSSSTPSLFASTMTSNASSGGFFGTANTTAPSTGGLFGSTTTSAPSGGLFGSTNTTAPSGGLFAATSMSGQPNAPASFFGTSTQPTQQQSQQADQQADAQAQPTRDGAYFRSLLERQKKKARLHGGDENLRRTQLPTLNMDLGDLARRAQEIGGKTGAQDSVADSRAHYLLAGSGVSPGKAFRDFQAIEGDAPLTEYRPPQSDAAFETEAYIKNLQSKGREAMMRESMDRVYREVDSYIEETLGIDFEEQKLRIMKHFGLINSDDDLMAETGQNEAFGKSPSLSRRGPADTQMRSVFGRSAVSKSIIGTPSGVGAGTSSFFKGDSASGRPTGLMRGQTARDLRDKERLFVQQITQLVEERLKQASFPVLSKFGDVESKAAGDSPRQLEDAYQALCEITKESTSTIKIRQYAPRYVQGQGQTAELSNQILEGSRTYLEKAFYREVESVVEKNPREGQLGGRPSVLNKVRAYIRVREARRDLAPDGAELQKTDTNGDYPWIVIFYLIRCGFVQEAADYVSNNTDLQTIDRRFMLYVTNYASSPDRRLSPRLQPSIDGDYQQRAKLAPKGTVDPYHLACYKVIGRCDISSRNLDTIGQGVEDWLWLQFALARQVIGNEDMPSDDFGLEQIQETISEIGQKHFQRGQVEGSSAYGTFFLMQILAGMFEQAVDYLHFFNPVSSVHFAIALCYYGLLRISDFNVAGHDLLTKTTTEQFQINFVPLIAQYTASFRVALPVAAVDYLTLICLNSDLPGSVGQVQTNACHECLRELCLETREFARLLGDIQTDGARVPGAIEIRAPLIKIESREQFLKAITTQAAAIADQRGQVADAVLLYHLCEAYDSVIGVLNRSLADAVAVDLGELPIQLQPLKPRKQGGQTSSPSITEGGSVSSLSLTQTSLNPVDLAKKMIGLYNKNAAYYNFISTQNRDIGGGLLRLLSARAHLEANPPDYMMALEELNELGVLPLKAGGSIPIIRSAASSFGALPQILARCIGASIVWAVRAIGGQRDKIMKQGTWDTGYGGDRDDVKEQLASMAKDLMVFAGLVKYKLPARVYDMLTRAGADVGGY